MQVKEKALIASCTGKRLFIINFMILIILCDQYCQFESMHVGKIPNAYLMDTILATTRISESVSNFIKSPKFNYSLTLNFQKNRPIYK